MLGALTFVISVTFVTPRRGAVFISNLRFRVAVATRGIRKCASAPRERRGIARSCHALRTVSKEKRDYLSGATGCGARDAADDVAEDRAARVGRGHHLATRYFRRAACAEPIAGREVR